MKYAKIIVKNNYEKEQDLVFRPLVRAYQKVGASTLLEDGNAILLGTIDDNGIFQELFTRKIIDFNGYQEIDQLDVWYKIASLSTEEANIIRSVIDKIIFNENITLDYEISTINDLANDRRVDFDAYNNALSSHNPYSEPYNGYNDFGFRLTKVR